MPYLEKFGIRGCMNFTTQHIARPNNQNDREIYVMAINKFLRTGKQLSYKDIPADHQTHKNKVSFLNRFSVVNPWGCSHTVVAHIAMDKSVDETWGIISQWYESFLSEDISHSSLQNMEKKELLSARKSSIRQMSWVKNNHINGTPTLLVDGRNIPTGYELEDLMLIY